MENSRREFNKLLKKKGKEAIIKDCREIARLQGTGNKFSIPILPGVYADLASNTFIFLETIN